MRFCNSFPRPFFLIAETRRDTMRVPSLLLVLSERRSTSTSAGKFDWQEYSEFRNSALLIYRLREADEPTTQNISGTRNIGK